MIQMEARSPPSAVSAPSNPPISPLRGLLEVTRLLGAEEELPELLSAIARTVAESLGYATVAINLYRPAWDDFCVTTVYGSEAAREALLGHVRDVSEWDVVLDDRFLRRGAYFIPHGAVDWEELGASYVPDRKPGTGADAWHPEDALFVPLRHSDGHLLGILSVDEPNSGLRAGDEELDVLAALSAHAALAVQAAQETADAGAPPARARGAARRFVAPHRRAGRRRDSPRGVQRHPRRARLPVRLGAARRQAARAARAARVRRLGARGSARDRRRRARRRRAVARLGVRDRRLLPAAERRGAQADPRRRGQLRLALQRARPARMGPALAARPAARRRGRPDRTDLGRRARRPAAPVRPSGCRRCASSRTRPPPRSSLPRTSRSSASSPTTIR